jgi:hypothetical protein
MSTRIIFCDRIQYVPSSEIDEIDGTDITLKSGFSMRALTASKVEHSSSLKESKAGFYQEQSLDIYSDIEFDDLNEILHRDLVFSLTLSNGSTVLFGSLDHPSRVSALERQLPGSRLTIQWEEPDLIF